LTASTATNLSQIAVFSHGACGSGDHFINMGLGLILMNPQGPISMNPQGPFYTAALCPMGILGQQELESRRKKQYSPALNQ